MGSHTCIMLRIHLIELLSKSQGLLIGYNYMNTRGKYLISDMKLLITVWLIWLTESAWVEYFLFNAQGDHSTQ